MVDTSTEAVTKLLDVVTPGPWNYIIGHSDWGLPRSNVVVPLGVSEFDFDAMIAEVKSVTPYCAGSSQKEREKSATADANARFIAASRDLVPALLAERDALRRENENLRKIERNVQAVREYEYKRAEAALAEVEQLKAQPVTVHDAAKVPEIKALIAALKPFADIGVSENPDFHPIIRMDRDAIIAARSALRAIADGRA